MYEPYVFGRFSLFSTLKGLDSPYPSLASSSAWPMHLTARSFCLLKGRLLYESLVRTDSSVVFQWRKKGIFVNHSLVTMARQGSRKVKSGCLTCK